MRLMKPSRILVLRLSSFGDVVLACSVLPALKSLYPESEITFVTSAEYVGLFKNNPYISRVIGFDKNSGLKGWVRLCVSLWSQRFDRVFDFHNSLRTLICRLIFILKGLGNYFKRDSVSPPISWKKISKERLRLFIYYVLKRKVPEYLRPRSLIFRFFNLVSFSGQIQTNLLYLLDSESEFEFKKWDLKKPYLCVMPSSKWSGKEWSLESHLDVLKRRSESVVIMGKSTDQMSYKMYLNLKSDPLFQGNRRVYFFNHQVSYSLFAHILRNSVGFYGVDTGFFHFAEALKVPSLMIMGPTEKGLGYPPVNPSSRVVELDMFCRPCSKNGQFCYRFWESRACLKNISPDRVSENLPF
jgi:ADP-heptose:LPS heptosyltransferase